jgi:hypothetical protein
MFQIMVKCQKRYILPQTTSFHILSLLIEEPIFQDQKTKVVQDVSNITVKVSNADDIGSCVYRDFKKR